MKLILSLAILVAGSFVVMSDDVARAEGAAPSITISLEDFPIEGGVVYGRKRRSDQKPLLIGITNGSGKWVVPLAQGAENPILTAAIPFSVSGPMTRIDAKAELTLALYLQGPNNEPYIIKYHSIRDVDLSPKGLQAIEKVLPANEPFPYRRLFLGAQALTAFESIVVFDSNKQRAARIMYDGALELYKRTETGSVLLIPDRAIVEKFVAYNPSASAAAWNERDDMFWLLVRRTAEPAIISENRWGAALQACVKPTSAAKDLQYTTVTVGFTKVKIPTPTAAAVPTISDCMTKVAKDLCPPVRERLLRIKFLFDEHLMREELRSAYSRKVIGSPLKEANLVDDARIRFQQLCDKDAFRDLYIGKAEDIARKP